MLGPMKASLHLCVYSSSRCSSNSAPVAAAPPSVSAVAEVILCVLQCCCLSWNMQRRDLFLSSSWDDSIKLYSINNPASMQTFVGHSYCVYHVAW